MRVLADPAPVALEALAVYRAPSGRCCRQTEEPVPGRPWATLTYCNADGSVPRVRSSAWADGFTLAPRNFWLLRRVY